MKRVEFPLDNDLLTEKEIREGMREKAAQPEQVQQARQRAYEKVQEIARAREVQEATGVETKNPGRKAENSQTKKHRWNGWKTFGSVAAAVAVFFGVCITNPAFAAKVPLIGHVFESLGDSLGFAGDYGKYAVTLGTDTSKDGDTSGEITVDAEKNETEITGETVSPVEIAGLADIQNSAFSQTVNGTTVTLSELYCNEKALYLSMLITTEDPFPETMIDQFGVPVINLYGSTLKLSYNPQEKRNSEYLDGQMIDEHTYAGVLRIDLENTLRWAEIDESLPEGEKPETDDQITWKETELPEQFTADLAITKIVGDLPWELVTTPEMPQDLIDEYEQAMAEAGLDTSEEAYASFTEEEQEVELALSNRQWREYAERYPQVEQYPNTYENWCLEGDWDFHLDVTVDHSETITQTENSGDACEIGEIQVTKTPFEIVLDYDQDKAKPRTRRLPSSWAARWIRTR